MINHISSILNPFLYPCNAKWSYSGQFRQRGKSLQFAPIERFWKLTHELMSHLRGTAQPISPCFCRSCVFPWREELEQHKENKERQHQEKDTHQQALHTKECELEGGQATETL